MAEHALRESVTLLLVNDALEANKRDRAEATLQLLDAVGTLIIDAWRHGEVDARETTRLATKYLSEQVAFYARDEA